MQYIYSKYWDADKGGGGHYEKWGLRKVVEREALRYTILPVRSINQWGEVSAGALGKGLDSWYMDKCVEKWVAKPIHLPQCRWDSRSYINGLHVTENLTLPSARIIGAISVRHGRVATISILHSLYL